MLLILCCCWPALERLFFILRLRSKLIPQPFQPVAFLLRLPREVPISASCNGGWLPWQTFIRNQWGAEREIYLFIVVKPSLKKKKRFDFLHTFWFCFKYKVSNRFPCPNPTTCSRKKQNQTHWNQWRCAVGESLLFGLKLETFILHWANWLAFLILSPQCGLKPCFLMHGEGGGKWRSCFSKAKLIKQLPVQLKTCTDE